MSKSHQDEMIGGLFLAVCLVIICWHWNPLTAGIFTFCGIMAYVYAIDVIVDAIQSKSDGQVSVKGEL